MGRTRGVPAGAGVAGAGLPPLRVSVNLSPSQFRGSGLDRYASARALDEAGLDPQYLEVELTESAVMSDPEESIAILEQLAPWACSCRWTISAPATRA